MSHTEEVIQILAETLQLGDRAADMDENTRLLGSIPEFDSMAVVSVLTTIEERLGIPVDDEDISADIFETVGSLSQFVTRQSG